MRMSRSTAESGICKFLQTFWTAHVMGESENHEYATKRMCRIFVEYSVSRYGRAIDVPFMFEAEYFQYIDAPSADSRKRIAERVAGMWLDQLDEAARRPQVKAAPATSAGPLPRTVENNPPRPKKWYLRLFNNFLSSE